jgi:hypothetical protein
MNKHKATVVEIGANVGPVYVFCLEIYADLLNVCRVTDQFERLPFSAQQKE